MSDEKGRYWLVFNGEIYNHTALRKTLIDEGIQFRTHSDTEVLLKWIIRYGSARLHALEGIFACIFLDVETKEMLVFRDKWGVKPLFYCVDQNGILLSSELNGLLKSGHLHAKLAQHELKSLLRNRFVPEQRTLFEGILEVPPGKVGRWNTDLTAIHWESMVQKTSFKQASLKQVLVEAVEAQLQAAVPVGIMLSGGVDSTLLAAIAARELHASPVCFTISTEGSEDYIQAQSVADKLKLRLETISLGPADFHDFLKFSASLSQPVPDPAVWLTYRIAQRASALGVKALLSGAGADELFGGYRRHQAFAWYLKFRQSPFWPVFKAFLPVLSSAASPKFQSILGGVSSHGAETFRHISGNQFPGLGEQMITQPEAFRIKDALAFDQQGYLQKDVLVTADLGGMMAGVEVRVPFLDTQVVHWAQNHCPSASELREQTKPVLKSLLNDFGFSGLAGRKKVGFGVPVDVWMQLPENKVLVNELITPESTVAQVIGFEICQQLLFSEGFSMEKAAMLMVEAWLKSRSYIGFIRLKS